MPIFDTTKGSHWFAALVASFVGLWLLAIVVPDAGTLAFVLAGLLLLATVLVVLRLRNKKPDSDGAD